MKRKPRKKGIVVRASEYREEVWSRLLRLEVGTYDEIPVCRKWLIRAGMPATHVPKKLRIIVEEVKE